MPPVPPPAAPSVPPDPATPPSRHWHGSQPEPSSRQRCTPPVADPGQGQDSSLPGEQAPADGLSVVEPELHAASSRAGKMVKLRANCLGFIGVPHSVRPFGQPCDRLLTIDIAGDESCRRHGRSPQTLRANRAEQNFLYSFSSSVATRSSPLLAIACRRKAKESRSVRTRREHRSDGRIRPSGGRIRPTNSALAGGPRLPPNPQRSQATLEHAFPGLRARRAANALLSKLVYASWPRSPVYCLGLRKNHFRLAALLLGRSGLSPARCFERFRCYLLPPFPWRSKRTTDCSGTRDPTRRSTPRRSHMRSLETHRHAYPLAG